MRCRGFFPGLLISRYTTKTTHHPITRDGTDGTNEGVWGTLPVVVDDSASYMLPVSNDGVSPEGRASHAGWVFLDVVVDFWTVQALTNSHPFPSASVIMDDVGTILFGTADIAMTTTTERSVFFGHDWICHRPVAVPNLQTQHHQHHLLVLEDLHNISNGDGTLSTTTNTTDNDDDYTGRPRLFAARHPPPPPISVSPITPPPPGTTFPGPTWARHPPPRRLKTFKGPTTTYYASTTAYIETSKSREFEMTYEELILPPPTWACQQGSPKIWVRRQLANRGR
ncbi:hypothetical protein BDN72DRAFT_865262 [Pluteus cervinus]|uniref:Uncharacterized protein n=1 Tax=Pluteus cervinus TaxID=181527 RepID=A0ACD3A122_9AGAR|nr:hypothetical protein BDN72DRAFT_865262 [Pluteus cervinus]